MLNINITISTKTGRRVNGTEADGGNKTHARVNGSWKAVCGTEPGKHADWSSYSEIMEYREACNKADKLITCEKCKKTLYKLSERPSGGCDVLRPF